MQTHYKIQKDPEKYILSQMQVKQQYEIIVFPKTFTIMNFYSKGLYNLEISLTAVQQSTGVLVKAFPFFVHGPGSVKNQEKKAKIAIKDDKLVYSSENYSFYVTFSAENFYFQTLPYFKLELERHKRYKVCLQFNLILTQYKISKQNSSKEVPKPDGNFLALGTIDQKILVVDSRKLYLNDLGQINTYQRLIFSEPDYFSYTDVYLLGVKTGTMIRPREFCLQQFYMSPIDKALRSKSFNKWFDDGIKQGSNCLAQQKLMSLFNNEGVVVFYRSMIQKPINEYKKLAHTYQHLRAMMVAMNNSTIAIPYLDEISKSIFSENSQTPKSQIQLKSLIQDYYQTQNQTQIYVEIIHVLFYGNRSQEAQLISRNKKWLFAQLCELLVKINYNVFDLLAGSVVRENMQKKQRLFIIRGDIQKQKQSKHSQFLLYRHNYCQTQQIVQQIDFKHPFIMLEGYSQEILQSNKKQVIPHYVIDNLVVFVHGYQGSDFDLQLAKYNLQLYNSHSYCLMSSSIQDQMDEPIEYLGIQLATQIKEHIKQSYNSYKRINFVGYSLGGILVREAMKYLQQFKDKMNIFLSLASPHAGTIDGGNILIKTGIWYLINFQNAKNLKQLNCQFEGKEQQNFILKKLSQCHTLNWFKKFVVASSEQDSFVPYPSSRIDPIQSSSITKIMCENINKRIKKLQRVEVWFDVAGQTGTFDKILGRKAHIQFLENKVFLHALFKLYANQF